ncbi:MAG: Hsp20/alpha crystallin family protein [Nitrospinaceae bacterium]|nr:Hsp20/alpha crystallin family protein [Nitrospinaceae bacterium]NIU46474.1 Hsp20/alpha crystallin family protein [Nitrospinaceae bacterium]NIW61217.1 Hsp20 family protein [Nitrospinaceae bacterium]
MNLVTYNPSKEFERLFDPEQWLNRAWEDVWPTRAERRDVYPRVNIIEQEGEYVLMAEVPGMKENDIEAELNQGVLCIRSTQRPEEKMEGTYYLQEFAPRSFERTFRLGEQVDPEKVSAHMEHGILYVRLAKRETAKPRKVEIKVGS